MNHLLTRRMFLLISLSVLASGCSESEEDQAKEKAAIQENADFVDKDQAYDVSQQFVNERLKSPGSAKYPYWKDNNVSVTVTTPGHYSISSYVDSQNTFGGLVRSNWNLTMHKEGDHYRLDDINITEQ